VSERGRPSSPAAVYLADRSAWRQIRHSDDARDRFHELARQGEVAVCPMIVEEILYAARSHREFLSWRRLLDTLTWLDTTSAMQRRALEIMESMARHGHRRGAGIPELVVAVTAEAHNATVLHYDPTFPRIAEYAPISQQWIVGRGTGFES